MNGCRMMLAAALLVASGPSSLPAQQSHQPRFLSDAATERIPNLGELKTELEQYHDCTCRCGCYAHDLDAQADRAIAILRARAAHRAPHEKLALILDIDDTTLSTYPEMLHADFAYIEAEFNQWLLTAQAPAIPGTLRLYKEAQRLGVNIIFLTGRNESQRAATEQNLREQGFDGWKLLVMRPEHDSQTIGAFKSVARGQIVGAGYTLALSVGDQWSDLKGKPEAEYSVKYPDPYYFIP